MRRPRCSHRGRGPARTKTDTFSHLSSLSLSLCLSVSPLSPRRSRLSASCAASARLCAAVLTLNSVYPLPQAAGGRRRRRAELSPPLQPLNAAAHCRLLLWALSQGALPRPGAAAGSCAQDPMPLAFSLAFSPHPLSPPAFLSPCLTASTLARRAAWRAALLTLARTCPRSSSGPLTPSTAPWLETSCEWQRARRTAPQRMPPAAPFDPTQRRGSLEREEAASFTAPPFYL